MSLHYLLKSKKQVLTTDQNVSFESMKLGLFAIVLFCLPQKKRQLAHVCAIHQLKTLGVGIAVK